MFEELIDSFSRAIKEVLEKYGFKFVIKIGIQEKEKLVIEKDVTAILGLIGNIKGNVAYSMTSNTAKEIISIMTRRIPEGHMEQVTISALAELSNVITGKAAVMFSKENCKVDITPPSVIYGENVYIIINKVKTTIINIATEVGDIQIHLALE
jgi:chemotaxis protein CheX